ncbi:hypothetical protein DFH07DRAFT_962028 [Mycena maculata]|uniref:Uncharacterized protein n=1 Tax=Mycena maculata TaxID=230809 RepID=A0AAD7N7Q6_9AGAR|nr:hypothetical protein DFH07DRAFT_962028 [Mycena maculata]
MSATNPRSGDERLGPDKVASWRAIPPHMSNAHGTAHASFHTAATETHSSAGHTTSPSSPSSPSGLTASVITAPSGKRYLVEADTNLRVDCQNGIVLTTADATILGTQTSLPVSPVQRGLDLEDTGEPLKLINELVEELNQAATASQIETLHALRGAFTTSRQHLLATTAATIDQRSSASETHAALVKLWDDTVQRLYDLHSDISDQHS